jgi:putative endonuclease
MVEGSRALGDGNATATTARAPLSNASTIAHVLAGAAKLKIPYRRSHCVDMRSESPSGIWRDLTPLRQFAQRVRAILFPPPTPAHLMLGRSGENLAVRHLQRNGHKILFRNFRAPHGGEVDIVCRDKRQNELVFVEVKTRASEDFGRPLDAVDGKKRRLILRGAMTWLRMLDMPDIVFRFDVIEVVISTPIEVRHIENAFRMPDNYSY